MIRQRHKNAFFFSIIFLTGLLICSSFQSVEAQDDFDNDGLPDSKESQLTFTYSPHLHFAAGENFSPIAANFHIDISVLYFKSEDVDTLIDSSSTTSSISLYHSGDYFLNNVLGGFEEIAQDYKQTQESLGYTVYTRVTKKPRVTKKLAYFVIQYWFFYAFNQGSLNQHQGDWEMIEIILDSMETPLYAVYSQHLADERFSWNNIEITGETHPRVYVALGLHANYFRPYQGKLGLENDIVGNAFTIKPDDLQITVLGEKGLGNHPPSQDWLE